MSFNQWDPSAIPARPGLYINFVKAAAAQIGGGRRGTVAIPLKKVTGGTAATGAFYTVDNMTDANELFGAANTTSIQLALLGGAKEVLVYTLPTTPVYADVRNLFEARQFNAFVYDGEIATAEQTDAKAWTIKNAEERKHFYFVTGGTSADDLNLTTGNSRSTTLAHDYVINLINGVTLDGVTYSSGQYAPYIAGLIASTPLNGSITYTQVAANDVTKRMRHSEIVTALAAGSLVLVHDGSKVKIERGIATSKEKLRKVSARQQIATDIEMTARDNYIGKLQNNEDGQMALINAIKAYLEALEVNNVLTDIVVTLDPDRLSVGDQCFLAISFTEIDSMEQILLTINV